MPHKRKLPLPCRGGSGSPEKIARMSAVTPSGLPLADLQRFRSLSRSVNNILSPSRRLPRQRTQPPASVLPVASPTAVRQASRSHKTGTDEEEQWLEEHHRSFVSAIYDVGMKHSSPSIILASMTTKSEALTGERLKSHLQKYRKNKVDNKTKFLKQYDIGVARLQDGWKAGRRSTSVPTMESELLPPGEQIALLTDKVLHEKHANVASTTTDDVGPERWPNGNPGELLETATEDGIPIPNLTEQEKKTSVGKSLILTLGMFRELRQHIQQLRVRSIPSARGPPASPLPSCASYSSASLESPPTKAANGAAEISHIATTLTASSPQNARPLIEQLASHCTEQYQKSKKEDVYQ
uniref:HTH myb-type domain-containing protein n=1 Tax=Grammatophora oceanica TaxID=210454 RepID=A0A7S1V5R5_9STRA|mmetsp:Transcript_37375/g.55690  ORF Transcript_37375/g.55690 Transcript_37375/m.55690 type:complete len:353 (+) Transcript_37375:316-1374(+)|eukprot:CAMPEP_0194026410 /NCGR_PEP_ID=MMETSP0009_2-20130614/724_1 /TAXON_ID=210454 /ORGANISM="Grammatophora oceanica, Strain CCMP 410" /LENGTH=352 /DNA_ID=CAMNT_0038665087 /DNA_START=314 /DNA_END=1372 /DNA_ORIENTATION=-